MYAASFKTTDGIEWKGWMGSGVPSKKGYISIKLEVAGGIAYIPRNEVDEDSMEMGENVDENNLTIIPPEKCPELWDFGKPENPNAGIYHKPSKVKPGSDLHKVVLICRMHPGKSRKELLDIIVQQIPGKSLAWASTYHQNAKPFINDSSV